MSSAADELSRSEAHTISLPSAGMYAGIAQVEAARGRLIHCVRLCGNHVHRYQMLAPTQWNFHPDHVLAQRLRGLAASDRQVLHEQTSLLVKVIDPCVACEVYLH